ncbi:hypothetical protein ACVRXQ_03660 [Streptococcus panodentis]|uniref:Uncharacterized protein n=1 Tax=Streptococcus panodentis TaxID=1581472 RepID=A0ABS5AW15_9STRE|nr:hypothetical protein [Streptococcus panodentis]MBP2620670.1 hypothetical protein [Streptococcus panodentis]
MLGQYDSSLSESASLAIECKFSRFEYPVPEKAEKENFLKNNSIALLLGRAFVILEIVIYLGLK